MKPSCLKIVARAMTLGVLISSQAGAQVVLGPVNGETNDYLIQQSGAYGAGARVGSNGGPSNWGRNGVFVFELPALPSGFSVESAELSLQIRTVTSAIDVGLYGLGFSSATTAMGNYYVGSAATDPSNNPLIISNLLNSSTTAGIVTTSAPQSTSLGAYLQTFYDANPTYDATTPQYAFLRLTPALTSQVQASVLSGYLVTFGNVFGSHADHNTLPTLTLTAVPEPSTYALLGLGLGALIWLRQRQSP